MSLKFLHVIYDFNPHYIRGGVQEVLRSISKFQFEKGCEVSVFTLYNPKDGEENHSEFTLVWEGVKIYYFLIDGVKYKATSKSKSLNRALEERAHLFDIVHSHCVFSPVNRVVCAVCKNRGIPYIVHLHGTFLAASNFRGFTIKGALRYVYVKIVELFIANRSSAVYCLNDKEEKNAIQWGVKSSKTRIFQNGVALPNINSNLLELKPVAQKKLLFLGRINPIKNIERIIKEFSIGIENSKGWVLVIYGDISSNADYYQSLSRLIHELGCQDLVSFGGYVNGDHKYKVYSDADAFIHLSHSEGMPMSVLEAMSVGLPSFVSSACNLAKAAKCSAVIEVELDDEFLGAKLWSMLHDGALLKKLSRNAVNYISEEHLWSNIVDLMLVDYQLYIKKIKH